MSPRSGKRTVRGDNHLGTGMEPFDRIALAKFYSRLSAADGISVAKFQQDFRELFQRPRSIADLNGYRLARKPWKKLADEVSPVSRFPRLRGIEFGQIRFPLDDNPPDCWLWEQAGADPVGIGVTIALARERHHLTKELIEKGISPGFLGVPENAPEARFDGARKRGRIMYSSAQVLAAAERSLRRRLSSKNHPRFDRFILVVQVPLTLLSQQHWQGILPRLQATARALPFREIHVISNGDEEMRGFQIK
jgi:hypothetical protein